MYMIKILLMVITIVKLTEGDKKRSYKDGANKIHRLETICSRNRSKTRLNINKDVHIFSFNSSLMSEYRSGHFNCHLELMVPSSRYGFSVFVEEMSLTGSNWRGCGQDWIQFGRDILFLTTHKSRKYCGQIELPVNQTVEGITRLVLPFTPLVQRIYSEEEDREMDIWIQVLLTLDQVKTFTLVVTPFKKSCGPGDILYSQCRYSTKCVRRELFCDGRINCAWPYSQPADELHCRSSEIETKNNFPATNISMIVVVIIVIVIVIVIPVLIVKRKRRKVIKVKTESSVRERSRTDDLIYFDQIHDAEYTPSCPPPPYSNITSTDTPPPKYTPKMSSNNL